MMIGSFPRYWCLNSHYEQCFSVVPSVQLAQTNYDTDGLFKLWHSINFTEVIMLLLQLSEKCFPINQEYFPMYIVL